jgi:hypothetical protein
VDFNTMRSFVLLVVLFAVAVLASNPSQPVWPTAFAASVLATDNQGNQRFTRWSFDATKGKERFDGMVPWNDEQYYAEMIRDFANDRQYDIFYQNEYASCFTHPMNGTVPHPDFTQYRFIGNAIVQYDAVYHWAFFDQSNNITFNYFDRQSDREPKRFDIADLARNWAETWMFMGFDDEPQDASLFVVNSVLLPLCNQVTLPPQKN